MIDHRLLDRMEARRLAVFGQAFDRDDVLAVELIEELDAGIDRLVAEAVAVEPADQDGAGPAVAFRADDLGAGQPQLVAQEVGQRGKGGLAADREALAVDVEAAHNRACELSIRSTGEWTNCLEGGLSRHEYL